MIAAVAPAFHRWRAAEFACPNHQSAAEQTRAVEIFQERRDRSVGSSRELFMIAFDIGMSVPAADANLNEPHPSLYHASGE